MAEEADNIAVVEQPVEQPIKSGLSRQLAQFKVDEKPIEKPVEKQVYDYTVFKDLDQEDFDKFKELKEKDEPTYHTLMDYRNAMKRDARLADARLRELNEFKSKSTVPEDVVKYKEFVEGLRTDALGTYKRYQKDFDLPEPEFLEKQVSSGGSVESRLQQWQDAELVPSIEKKFKLESGTFTYDSNEAFKVGTPSYEYRKQTADKEQVLNNEYQSTQTRQETILQKVTEQNNTDLKFLRETYFPNTEFEVKNEKNEVDVEQTNKKANEAFVSTLTRLDEIQSKIKQGEFDASSNPFALKNIYRGIFFDELVVKAVDKAINDLNVQYNAKGLYLGEKPKPTDLTRLKGTAGQMEDTGQKKKFGVMHKVVSNTLSQS